MESETSSIRPGVRLFALVIGINKYISGDYLDLHGAVGDAEAMERYFRETLKVSREYIRTLYDDQATRGAIINSFRDLRDDARISRGDPIVIFYSGHGGKLTAVDAWRGKKVIECLIPHDCEATEPEPGQRPKPVPGHEPIPDRTIGVLLDDIAKKKGDNITVIFDCCHSGSGTRDQDEEYIARGIEIHFDLPQNLDSHLFGGRDVATVHGPSRSHVLLAACGEDELAWEDPKTRSGQFTTALLKALKNFAENNELAFVTYAELIDKLPLKRPRILHYITSQFTQHPRCEGINQHRFLFNGKVSEEIYYAVTRKEDKYVISAGLAHGISRGVEFTLYDDKKKDLGLVLVDRYLAIEDFATVVIIPLDSDLSAASFAKPRGIGKLPLYVDQESLPSFHHATQLSGVSGTSSEVFLLVGANEAKLEVTVENNSAIFRVLDSERRERGKKFGLTKFTYTVSVDDIGHVLRSAAHYYWFLDFAKEHGRTSVEHEVDVDFFALSVDYDDYGEPVLSPNGPGFCKRDPTSSNQVIDFVVDPDQYYGIKITNKTKMDLYLNVFLFNDSSWSIVRYYTSGTPDKHAAPLKQGGTFTIGYETGTPPLTYSLDEGQDIDVGFLKIFFTTQPVDLSNIAQETPFGGARDLEGQDGITKSGVLIEVVKALSKLLSHTRKSNTWFTLDIPVVQRAA